MSVEVVPHVEYAARSTPERASALRRAISRARSFTTLLVCADLAAVAVAALIAGETVGRALVACVVLLGAMNIGSLYRARLNISILDDLPRLAVAWLAASAFVLMSDQWGDGSPSTDFVLVLGGLVLLDRIVGYQLTRRLRSSGAISHRSLVIGTTGNGRRIGEILHDRPEYGLRPIGFLDDRTRVDDSLPVPVIGDVRDLARVIVEHHIGVAVLASGVNPDVDLVQLVRSCHRLRCELFVLPQYTELHNVTGDTEVIWGIPMVRLRRAAHRSAAWRLKRLMDTGVALAALIGLAPLMLALAAAVRIEGGPGVIFRQTRVGIDGQQFDLFKFRSMRPVDETESATTWNIAQDDRVGPVGRFIRRTSLDELPQLFNILRGDMSLVGPRPERPHFVAEFSSLYPSYKSRDRVPCGLTGWAQVHGLRGDTAIDERADFDNFYIENWSLWLDLKIMLKTMVSVVSAPGA